MKHKFEWTEKCKGCNGTGIYIGLAERGGFGVVCNTCEGSGKCDCVIEWEDFEEKVRREDVKHVIQINPGIVCGIGDNESGNNFTYEDFGGMSYKEWFEGKDFPEKSEMRQFVCPAWWYQMADFEKKPKCDFFCGRFSECKNFPEKEKCWEKWDEEFGGNQEELT